MGVGVGPAVRSGSQFVGRQAESALVGLTIDQPSSGAPTAVIVRGEPGIGKTRLLAEAVARARAKAHHVIWVRSNALERRIPFGALSVALADAAAADPAFELGADAVRSFVADAGSDESARLPFAQVCDALTTALIEAGEHGPTSVVIDVVHLLDRESLALLGVTLGRVAGRNVSFVCSTRAPGWDVDNHASELLARLAEWPDVDELELGPLGEDQVSEVLEGVFDRPVSPAVAEMVTRRSGGNPLFVLEIARSLQDLDILDNASFDIAFQDAPGALHLTRHTAILRRLFPLTPECRQVAQVIAVLHRVRLSDLDLVAEITQLHASDVAGAFDELERRGIIASGGGEAWTLFHPFVADALYDDIGPAERRRVHRRIAEHLRGRRDAGDLVDLTQLAWHVSASADVGDDEAAAILGAAAESIKHAGPLSAADLCERALSLLPAESSQRTDMLSLRTRCLILAGRPSEAVESGLAALDTMTAGEERTRTATAVIAALFDVGRVDDARALAEREVSDGVASTFVLAQRAMMVAAQGHVDEARRAIDAAMAMPTRSAGEEVLVRSFLASAALLSGAVADGVEHLQHVADAAPEAGANMLHYGLSRRCWSLVAGGFATDGAAALVEAEGPLGDVGRGQYSSGLTVARIGLEWMRGDWDQCLASIADVSRGVDILNNAVLRRFLQSIEVDIRTVRGQLREALALVNQPIAAGSATLATWAAAGALRAIGDDSGARALLRRAVERPTDRAWLPHALLRLLELEHLAGDDRAARATLSQLEAVADPVVDPRPWVHSVLLRGRAVVDRDHDVALASAAVADSEGLAYDAALARLLAGELDPAATEPLLAAHEVFGTLGAEADRRRAGALLRERGAKVPRRRRRSPGELTSAEADIARLVQAGMRNRDIARTTNYSERTVEVYLSRIYAKLGVSSRLQLARLLDEHGVPVEGSGGHDD